MLMRGIPLKTRRAATFVIAAALFAAASLWGTNYALLHHRANVVEDHFFEATRDIYKYMHSQGMPNTKLTETFGEGKLTWGCRGEHSPNGTFRICRGSLTRYHVSLDLFKVYTAAYRPYGDAGVLASMVYPAAIVLLKKNDDDTPNVDDVSCVVGAFLSWKESTNGSRSSYDEHVNFPVNPGDIRDFVTSEGPLKLGMSKSVETGYTQGISACLPAGSYP